MEHFRWLLLSFLYITNVTLITWTFTNSTWVKGFAIIIGAMQGKLKLAFTIKRPKMVKGHCLQWSPQNKIFSTFKSERIQCQEWNFCGVLNKWSSCHFFFFFCELFDSSKPFSRILRYGFVSHNFNIH